MIVFLWIALAVLIAFFCLSGFAAFAEGMSDAGDDGGGDVYSLAAVSFLIGIVAVIVLIVRHYLTT